MLPRKKHLWSAHYKLIENKPVKKWSLSFFITDSLRQVKAHGCDLVTWWFFISGSWSTLVIWKKRGKVSAISFWLSLNCNFSGMIFWGEKCFSRLVVLWISSCLSAVWVWLHTWPVFKRELWIRNPFLVNQGEDLAIEVSRCRDGPLSRNVLRWDQESMYSSLLCL